LQFDIWNFLFLSFVFDHLSFLPALGGETFLTTKDTKKAQSPQSVQAEAVA